MARRMKWLVAALCFASAAIAATNVKQEASLEAGRRAYEASDYAKAILELQGAAAKEPQNGDVQLLLAKSYLELQERDPAIKSADKAVAQIKQLAEMDAAEGHFAAGNCRRQKKDFAVADEEFAKALESHPKSAELIYDIGDYAVKRSQPEWLLAVADTGERVAPGDPRGQFYRGVALVLKKENLEKAERLLTAYAKKAPIRSGYPRPAAAHAWLGRLFEDQNMMEEAAMEFEIALNLDPKNKMAQEALKRLKKG